MVEIPEVKKRKNNKRRERKQKRHRDEFVWKDIIRVDDDKDPSKRRRWEDMDHVILVNIMKRLLQVEQEGIYTNYYYFSICKSWGFRLSLMLVLCLRPTTHYSKMVVGKDGLNHKLRILRLPFYEIYKMLTPSLRELELPYADAFHTGPFWSPNCYEKLEAIFFSALKLPHLVRYSKCIHTLRLYGTIGDGEAYLIAKISDIDRIHDPSVKALEWKVEEESVQGIIDQGVLSLQLPLIRETHGKGHTYGQ
ncbi:hypothetical protein CCACVL1_00320 [Corchorus capsularis]|uniref:Uncharacterized protein n=1 Tax=Corchorus capsularis TaxID=210143 RepID=A0A1R3KXA4_COCAP|nr:hypothetical protein CCACVL1_00320 [Corchorus capsularis]